VVEALPVWTIFTSTKLCQRGKSLACATILMPVMDNSYAGVAEHLQGGIYI